MEKFIAENLNWLVPAVILWTLPWKGVVLWKAARANAQNWFIALLLFNTLAILDILYIFVFNKKDENI